MERGRSAYLMPMLAVLAIIIVAGIMFIKVNRTHVQKSLKTATIEDTKDNVHLKAVNLIKTEDNLVLII